MVNKLLSTQGHLNFDQLSGRLRYFGPTTNCHIHCDLHLESEQTHQHTLNQQYRTKNVIGSLSEETHDYLLGLFWIHYNTHLQVIHRPSFEECRQNHGPFYSGFLHIVLLAVGYRYADKTRLDMMEIALPNSESKLQKEAKSLLDYEIEQPGSIPTIAALLLLGDLECTVGRDNVGWLYAGMANRLCFDIGLHLDRSDSDLSPQEIEIGRMTFLACTIYDRYWALFLGRPTSLKQSGPQLYNLSQQFKRLVRCHDPEHALEMQIYEALLDLMEIAGNIIEIMDQASTLNNSVDSNHVFVRMANLNRELEMWYTRLPKHLRWSSENLNSAPFPFFILHQQYHVAMILLHRPFARYGEVQVSTDTGHGNTGEYEPQLNSHLSLMSRTICTQHAVRVARIFWHHRQKFETKHIFVTGLQHAGTAATALIAALASLTDSASRDANMHHLECLAAALGDMAETYLPAKRMSAVLEAVLIELRATVPQLKDVVPARTRDSNDEEMGAFRSAGNSQPVQTSPPQPNPLALGHAQPIHLAPMHGLQNPMPIDWQNLATYDLSLLDGFDVVTPRAENTSTESAHLILTQLEAPSANDTTFASAGLHFDGPSVPAAQDSAWMGAQTPASPSRICPVPANSTFLSMSNDHFDPTIDDLGFVSFLSNDKAGFPEVDVSEDHFRLPVTPAALPVTSTSTKSWSCSTSSKSNGITKRPIARHPSARKDRTMLGLDNFWNQIRESANVK